MNAANVVNGSLDFDNLRSQTHGKDSYFVKTLYFIDVLSNI